MNAERIRAIGLWLSAAAAKWPVLSWLMHGVAALPMVPVLLWQPWTGPGLFFLYREGEQVLHRWLNKQPLSVGDHVMDVLVPLLVGYVLIR